MGRLLTRYSPVRHCPSINSPEGSLIKFSFDLHVLGTPPAFVLSQDQTLHCTFSLNSGRFIVVLDGRVIPFLSFLLHSVVSHYLKDLLKSLFLTKRTAKIEPFFSHSKYFWSFFWFFFQTNTQNFNPNRYSPSPQKSGAKVDTFSSQSKLFYMFFIKKSQTTEYQKLLTLLQPNTRFNPVNNKVSALLWNLIQGVKTSKFIIISFGEKTQFIFYILHTLFRF